MTTTTTRALCGEHGAPITVTPNGITCGFSGPRTHPLTDPNPCEISLSDLTPEAGERLAVIDGGLYIVDEG